MNKQVKSRQRVTDLGEVFTATREVKAMCDLAKTEIARADSRILEPACGDGNFLAEILSRRLSAAKSCDGKTLRDELFLAAVGNIYGIDIMSDNCRACRKRLFEIWQNAYISDGGKNSGTVAAAEKILSRNIICGNSLTYECFEGEKPTISFCEWDFRGGLLSCMHEHSYENLAANEKFKFDVIIGNPPYHENDGGNGASAKPIYHHFVNSAKKLNPDSLIMIIPARWYAGGKGLDKFRAEMLSDRRMTELHDFVYASDCFSGVEIKGGVCYFLWKKNHSGTCKVVSHSDGKITSEMDRYLSDDGNGIFIRYNGAIPILRKIALLGEYTFDKTVSPRKPFGFASNFKDFRHEKSDTDSIKIYVRHDTGYISKNQIKTNPDWIEKWKVYIPEAIGAGKMNIDVVKPILGAPGTVCSETYVVAAPTEIRAHAENCAAYISTKFFHFLLGLKKISQHTTSKTYSFVPVQDFSQKWTDEMLYKKYCLSKKEIEFIEKSVWNKNN